MATTIIYADTTDNHVESTSATYANTRAGTGTLAITAHPLAVGQHFASSTKYAWETFIAFDTTGLSNVEDASLYFTAFNPNHVTFFVIEARARDWGTAVETTDWIDGANLGNYTLLASLPTNNFILSQQKVGILLNSVPGAWAANINTAGKTRIVVHSDRLRTGQDPTVDEAITVYGSDATGTVDDPRLVVYSGSPTLVGQVETTWTALSPSTKTTASFDVVEGDLLVAYSFTSDDLSGQFPIAVSSTPSLTWSNETDGFAGTGSYASTMTDSAIADFTGSMTVTFTAAANSTTVAFGGGVLIFRNASGVGASTFANSGTGFPSLTFTTQQANSAIVWAHADWDVIDGSSISANPRAWQTLTGFPPVETTYRLVSGDYTVYSGVYPDAGAAGSKTVGVTNPPGQQWMAVALEIIYQAPAPAATAITVELWENGSLKQSLGSADITAEGVLSYTWDAATLTAISGADVELRITSDGDVDVGAIEWNSYRAPAAGVPVSTDLESWGLVLM